MNNEKPCDCAACAEPPCLCRPAPSYTVSTGSIIFSEPLKHECLPAAHDFSATRDAEERPILFCRKCGTTRTL